LTLGEEGRIHAGAAEDTVQASRMLFHSIPFLLKYGIMYVVCMQKCCNCTTSHRVSWTIKRPACSKAFEINAEGGDLGDNESGSHKRHPKTPPYDVSPLANLFLHADFAGEGIKF
jgi:hypothetical protein